MTMLPWNRVCTFLNSFISLRSTTDLGPSSRSYHPLPVNKTFIKRSRPAWFCRGSRWAAIRLVFRRKDWHRTRLEEDDRKTNPTSTIAGPDSQTQDSDWKANTKDRLGVASRFTQTLLKKLPGCISTNPVTMAFSIAKVIIEIKDVGCCLCISGTGWLLYQVVGNNNDELAQRLEETANRLLAVERTIVSGVPKAAEKAMANLKSYVVFCAPKEYHKEYVTQDPWKRNEGIEGPCR